MPHPGPGFPQPFQKWPLVGQQWPIFNIESDQADGLVMWMPWGGGYPGLHRHADLIGGFVFTEGGTPTWVFDDERGWSLLFDDAQSEYLSVDTAVLTGAPITMACWFYNDDYSAAKTMMSVCSGSSGRYFMVQIASWGIHPITYIVRDAGGQTAINTSTGITENKWHHQCSVSAAADDHWVLLDAGGKGTSAVARTPPGLDITVIGGLKSYGSFSGYFSGCISDARVYNRALTDAQVAELIHPDTKWELYQIPRRLWRLGAIAPPPTGQPIHLRALDIPYMRQWQPGRR